MYQVRRVHLGKTAQLDELAHECGQLYTQTLVFFWRTVRHKGIWLKEKHLKRLFTSKKLHAHTADACVESFFASLKSWRERKKAGDPDAHPPRRRKWYFRIEYKRSAMSLKDGKLRLSNGKGNEPLVLEWPWELPKTVVIHWTGTRYEAIATYKQAEGTGTIAQLDAFALEGQRRAARAIELTVPRFLHAKGIVSLAVGEPPHQRAPFCVTPSSASWERWQVRSLPKFPYPGKDWFDRDPLPRQNGLGPRPPGYAGGGRWYHASAKTSLERLQPRQPEPRAARGDECRWRGSCERQILLRQATTRVVGGPHGLIIPSRSIASRAG